jgi:hypothetical protein
MFHKHEDKLTIGKEITSGPLISKVRNIRVADIISILEVEDNEKKLTALLARL